HTPASPPTSCQEMIVANNILCSAWPAAWQPGRRGSAELSGTWLALSEFHYCRHNSCSMEFSQAYPLQTKEKPARPGRSFVTVMWNCSVSSLVCPLSLNTHYTPRHAALFPTDRC